MIQVGKRLDFWLNTAHGTCMWKQEMKVSVVLVLNLLSLIYVEVMAAITLLSLRKNLDLK